MSDAQAVAAHQRESGVEGGPTITVVQRSPAPLAGAVGEPEAAEPEVSVVMPCLNEARTLAACITKARDCLAAGGVTAEIIVADNGSTDGSQEIARSLGARVVDVPVRGYGAALLGGINAARGRYIIMGDADDSYDFANLMPFIRSLRDGNDLVMGNRFAGGIQPGAMPWLNRYVGNPVLSAVGKVLFRTKVGDFHCGLRGFSKAAAQRMDLRTTGMEFASEMVVKASLLGMRVAEVPTTLSPDGRDRPPHLRRWRDGWRHLRFMLVYSPRYLFFYPGLALLALGVLLGAWLLPGPRTVGGVTLDVHTLLVAAAAVLVGFQAVAFAVLTQTFAQSEGLVPRSAPAARLLPMLTLERGLIAGAIVLLVGLAMVAVAVWQWGSVHFGDLDYRRTMRLVIPGVTLTALGVQAVLSSCFIGILTIRRR
jgi:hypothetical protein